MYQPQHDPTKPLYDYFGRGGNDVMKRLRALRWEALTAQGKAEEAQRESTAEPDAIEQSALDH